MSENGYLLAVMGVMALATFLTRVLPFVAFRHHADHPVMQFLGRYMPPAIMTLLVLYTVKSVDLTQPPFAVHELLALVLTCLLHLWRGNALLSIFSGTLFYMWMVQSALFI